MRNLRILGLRPDVGELIIKKDRAKRYIQSAIRNPQSKIVFRRYWTIFPGLP
ncbi:hypothetical protein D1AOALGA4SA_4574 [Olavius algarvensis Delta 1 endosymbiont]|nr:hypothetical protein D1AOALGA4SA_4574 [Olavius algarvensis Delta 1 endosymbiont]